MKIEELQQTTIQRQIKNGYEENQVKNAWIAAQTYGEFEAILFKSIKGKQSQKSTQSETTFLTFTKDIITKDNKAISSDDEDENLKKAIEASKTIYESESYQGGMRLRKSGIPCGLYNMGSTCYFNCLIQTYYVNQDFYQAILDWDPPENQKDLDIKISQAFLFLESLKTIFLKMLCSDYLCVIPEDIFSYINVPDGINIDFYQQQDIAEFNHILLEKIETAMLFRKQTNHPEVNSEENTFYLLKQNFFGKLECEIIVQNQVVENYQEEFNYIQIDVSSNKLQDGLVNFLNSKVEYYKNSQNQLVANTLKKCKFIELPSVFQFQIQRVKFSSNSETTKDTRELYFDVVLDVKEYCSSSLLMENQEDDNDDNDDTQSTLESLLINLQGTYNFYQIQGSQQKEHKQFQMQKQQDIDQILQSLTQSINFIKQKIEQRKLKKNRKQIQPEQINTRYHLQSIIIHQGTPSYGHYYAFIKDFYLNKWFKYNDYLVEEISEQEVLEISYGKQKTKYDSSTYLIMYLNENKVLKEKNSKIPIRSFLTNKDQDFLNDVYGRFAKEKQNQQVEKILKDNNNIQTESNTKKYEKIIELPFNTIIQQYKKNYDWILLKDKQYKQNQQINLIQFPFLSHLALFQNYLYQGKHDNIKWYCLDLAIKQQYNNQYGIFIGNIVNTPTQQYICQLLYQSKDKYSIYYPPERSPFLVLVKKYQLSLKACIFCNEVIKNYFKNQYFDCIKALQALVNLSRQLEDNSQFLEITIILRFQIPFRILSHIIKSKNQEQLFEIIHFIIAFEKQEFFEFKKEDFKEFTFQLLQNLILNSTSNKRLHQYFQPQEKQLQEAKQELIKQQEIFTNSLQEQIQQLLQKCDPKCYDLEKIDDSFLINCQENISRFIYDVGF